MTRTIKSKKGNWKIMGVNISPTDSLYKGIQEAIDENNLSQSYLQNISGCRAPIVIDKEAKTINFASF